MRKSFTHANKNGNATGTRQSLKCTTLIILIVLEMYPEKSSAGEGNNYFCALLLDLSNLPVMGPQTPSVWWGTFQVIHPPIPLLHAGGTSPCLCFQCYSAPCCFPSFVPSVPASPQGCATQSLGNCAQKCLDSSVPVSHTPALRTLTATTAK